jgi:putative cell wall-binding protein/lysophospholipase L1-like esterase
VLTSRRPADDVEDSDDVHHEPRRAARRPLPRATAHVPAGVVAVVALLALGIAAVLDRGSATGAANRLPLRRATSATVAPAGQPTTIAPPPQATAPAPAPPGQPSGPRFERLAGADRYATAAAVSAATFAPDVPVVYLASGTGGSDALAAGPAAAAGKGPVLLTEGDALPPATRAELVRLQPRAVVVLGGAVAVAPGVATTAALAAGSRVTRLAGIDRVETAGRVAEHAFTADTPVAYLVRADDTSDAIAAAAAAASTGGPLLLTGADTLPDPTVDALRRLRPREVVLVGRAAALADGVRAVTGAAIRSVAGPDRLATAAAVAAGAHPTGAKTVFVASSERSADALAGGAAAGHLDAPILLVPPTCLPDTVVAELTRLHPERIVVLGGPAAVSTAIDLGVRCGPHAPRPLSATDHLRVWIGGDSMGGVPGDRLRLMLGRTGKVDMHQDVRVGTGLNRLDVHDWYGLFLTELRERNPDVVVLTVGANDPQPIHVGGTGPSVPFANDAWRAEYARRTGAAMDALTEGGRLVLWVGEPVMRDQPLHDQMLVINEIFRAEAARHIGVVFIDTWAMFATPDGKYWPGESWRASDGVHFTPAGGDRLAGIMYEHIAVRWRL